MPILRDIPLNIEVDDLLRAQGAEPHTIRARRPAIVRAAETALESGRSLLEPLVLYEIYPVEALHHERLILKGGKTLNGPLIATHAGRARQVIALVCTIGPALETHAADLMRTDPLRALALDALGSAAAEVLAVSACNLLETETTTNGWHASMPLNPGMIGWPVEQGQPELFALLDASQIGIQLTEGGVMKPLKSVSLVMGIGPDLSTPGKPCDYCTMSATCRYQYHYA